MKKILSLLIVFLFLTSQKIQPMWTYVQKKMEQVHLKEQKIKKSITLGILTESYFSRKENQLNSKEKKLIEFALEHKHLINKLTGVLKALDNHKRILIKEGTCLLEYSEEINEELNIKSAISNYNKSYIQIGISIDFKKIKLDEVKLVKFSKIVKYLMINKFYKCLMYTYPTEVVKDAQTFNIDYKKNHFCCSALLNKKFLPYLI